MPVTQSSTAMDLLLPFRVLISPLKTFSQLSQRPTARGLITLAALILVVTAAAQYASATRIILTIDDQQISFMATGSFVGWLMGALSTTMFSIVIYWLVFAAGMAVISRFLAGKETTLRNSLVILAYMLSVFAVLYGVRTVMYLALPSILFQTASWPPVDQADVDKAVNLMTQTWGSLPIYQFGSYFTLVAFAWLVILGAVAVKAMRETSWAKAGVISTIGFVFTLFLFGLP